MLGTKSRVNQANCTHTTTITISAAGMERSICEACGHVSFDYQPKLSKSIDRDRFARTVDEFHLLATAS